MNHRIAPRNGRISIGNAYYWLLAILDRCFSKLKGQWEERVGLISALEESVQQLQERSRQREEKLLNERDAAIGESRFTESV